MYQFQGQIGTKEEENVDLEVHQIWRYFGFNVTREDLETDWEARQAKAKAEAASVSRGRAAATARTQRAHRKSDFGAERRKEKCAPRARCTHCIGECEEGGWWRES